MADTVQQIKDRLSIVDVVSQYVKLERSGSSLRARCPFHSEKTASFFVSAERGTYHCFGCGVGGDMYSFVQQIEGVDFKGALRMLAEKAGVPLDYARGRESTGKDERDRLFELMDIAAHRYSSNLDGAGREYLKGRGVLEVTMYSFRIGLACNEWDALSTYAKSKGFSDAEIVEAGLAKKNERGGMADRFRNRIMFPIADSAGRVIAFSGRSFGEHASPEAPKYLNSPETILFHKSSVLYGFDKAKLSMRKADCAVLVEGQMDLILSHQAGWGNTVAVSGTAFTEEHAKLIKRHTDNLVIALDADQAGIKAAARAAREALRGGLNVKVAALPAGSDPADLISQKGPEAWRTVIRAAKDIIVFLLDVLERPSTTSDATSSAQLRVERFRRAVETVVLPFLSDVSSPIAREQYVREIARRLGVSQEAVLAALSRLPTTPQETVASSTAHERVAVPSFRGRADHALALLLWQEQLSTPKIDTVTFSAELESIIGPEMLARARGMSEKEMETLRFSAERLFGESANLDREAADLLYALTQETLRRELAEAARALEVAERAGEHEKMAQIEEKIKLLTTHIARSHTNR